MKRSHLALLGGIVAGGIILRRYRARGFSFAGKVVLITGGSRGLGLVIARQLAGRGARLALLARHRNELERAAAELKERGAEVLKVPCDLTEREQIISAVREIASHFGGVDVLINNAGIIEVGPLAHMTRADFERSLALHFWAPLELTMLIRPMMKRRGGGRIVNISSIGGKIAVPHLAPYAAGKFALTGFSDSVRAELARENILVTTVAPGMMRTGSHVNARFKGDHSAEFAWFSFSNALPLVSMAAERAAAKIIRACARGQSALTLTMAARAAIAANAVAPSFTGELMKLANRLLPGANIVSGDELRSGAQLRRGEGSLFTRHLDAASSRNNEN